MLVPLLIGCQVTEVFSLERVDGGRLGLVKTSLAPHSVGGAAQRGVVNALGHLHRGATEHGVGADALAPFLAQSTEASEATATVLAGAWAASVAAAGARTASASEEAAQALSVGQLVSAPGMHRRASLLRDKPLCACPCLGGSGRCTTCQGLAKPSTVKQPGGCVRMNLAAATSVLRPFSHGYTHASALPVLMFSPCPLLFLSLPSLSSSCSVARRRAVAVRWAWTGSWAWR